MSAANENSPDPRDAQTESGTVEWETVPTREVVSGSATAAPAGAQGQSEDAIVPADTAGATNTADDDGAVDRERPAVDVPGTTGLSIGMWVSLVVGAVILVLLLVFILQNNVATEIHYFGWTFSLPLGVALLLSAVGGLLIAGVIGSIRIFQLGHRLRKVSRALK